jgi:hypothetical protein
MVQLVLRFLENQRVQKTNKTPEAVRAAPATAEVGR